jgi:hypothetical protein
MISDPLELAIAGASGLTDEQIAYRRRYVCGSDAGKVMEGKWRELWQVKTGVIVEPTLYDQLMSSSAINFHVLKHFTRERLELTRLLGHATEPLNAFWYTSQTGREVTRRGEWAVSKRHPFMGAHLDGVSTTSRGEPCYWDAKWTGRADEAFLLRHTPQGTHNATILGVDWWGLSVFIGNGKWEWIEQPVDPLYQAKLIQAERRFWDYVERGEEPIDHVLEVAPPAPQPKLRTVSLDGGTYDPDTQTWEPPEGGSAPNWASDAVRLIYSFHATEAAFKRHAIVRDELKALVPEDVGAVLRGDFKLSKTKAGAVTMTIARDKERSDG